MGVFCQRASTGMPWKNALKSDPSFYNGFGKENAV